MTENRNLGRIFTIPEIIDFMTDLVEVSSKGKILEPGCAFAPFLTTLRKKLGTDYEFWGVEIDEEVFDVPYWVKGILDDFILFNANEKFDLIIGNPPYGIIGDSSKYPIHQLKKVKNLYKSIITTWKGKYNIYAAFIEKSIHLLNDNGQLIFIVPATWFVLDEFSLLREFLAKHGSLRIYYFGKIFDRNVNVVVINFKKGKRGFKLYEAKIENNVAKVKELYENRDWNGDWIRFETLETKNFKKSNLFVKDIFDIYFAARSTEFKKSEFVKNEYFENSVPILTGRNLKENYIDYENNYSKLWMLKEDAEKIRSFYKIPHIVVAHTKGTKVVAAFDEKGYPWREEFHLIKKKDINEEEIVKYFNSQEVQKYVKELYRDVVPHLTKRMLEELPIWL